jgi:putative ABC transport system substrate-binding protein
MRARDPLRKSQPRCTNHQRAVGRNARIDIRWGADNVDTIRKHAVELVALAPDVIFGNTFPIILALQQSTRGLPIVFAGIIDPVGAGLVSSLAQPGGNTTGVAGFEYGMSVIVNGLNCSNRSRPA